MVRIAITGMGIVAACGVGVEAFRSHMQRNESWGSLIERFDTAGLSAHSAALIRDFNPRDFISPMKMRRMNVISRYAISAARLALRDRELDTFSGDVGVALGTAFGPVQTSVEYMQEYVEKGAALAPPQLFAESVANAPGSHIAIEFGLRGFNITVTQRESSALAALMYAASQVAKGGVSAAFAGGFDEVNEMLFSVLDRLGALAHDGGDGECARPFDRRRNGMMMGEGGAVLITEVKPSRQPYAWISGFGMARDTTASISDWGVGSEAIVSAMRAAIGDAGISVEDVNAVYASANSSRRGDRVEAEAIAKLFGSRVPPVVATKGVFGEYAAGGALHVAAAVLAVADQVLHASSGFEEACDTVTFDVNREYRGAALDHVLVNSVSAGGGIVSAVLSRGRV